MAGIINSFQQDQSLILDNFSKYKLKISKFQGFADY